MARVTFGAKEQRRDQRRPISIEGSIGGVRVDLVDLSFTGIRGGMLSLGDAAGLDLQEGEGTVLEFTAPNGERVALPVTIQRIDDQDGAFGAVFSELSSEDFDAIEKLMFPRRAK
jgi:hypothetical protein